MDNTWKRRKETMTMTSYENAQGAREIIVRDEAGPLSFTGEVVADLSWSYDAAYDRGHNRWTDITMYHVLQENTPYEYVIQVVGRSVLYHRPNSPCGFGVNVPVGKIRKDEARYGALESCQVPACQPADLDDLDDGSIVAVEQDRYTLYRCKDASEVIEVMHMGGGREQRLSLSGKLLQEASLTDEKIAAAMIKSRRL